MFTVELILIKYTWLSYDNRYIYPAQNTIFYTLRLDEYSCLIPHTQYILCNFIHSTVYLTHTSWYFDIHTSIYMWLCAYYIYAWSRRCVIKNEFYQLTPHQTVIVSGLSTVGQNGNGNCGKWYWLMCPTKATSIVRLVANHKTLWKLVKFRVKLVKWRICHW